MSSANKILKEARALIADESNWCKGALTKDGRGTTIDTDDALQRIRSKRGKYKCCLYGALYLTAEDESTRFSMPYVALLSAVRKHTEHNNIPDFNDAPETTHADVLRVLDKAIASTESIKS